mgnify:FL=1
MVVPWVDHFPMIGGAVFPPKRPAIYQMCHRMAGRFPPIEWETDRDVEGD